MAHHRPDILRELLAALDDPRNDVYLHIDRKGLNAIDPDGFDMRFSRLTIIPSINVSWAGYSQIKCVLSLLKAAVRESRKHGNCYTRYHLMTGATYPIKSQDEIHAFFDRYPDREYMDFDESDHEERVRYIHLFNESGLRSAEPRSSMKLKLRRLFIELQQRLGCDRFSKYGMKCCKGLAYWSITHELAEYVLKNRKLIRRMMKYSTCGDEIFMQTLVWNSLFRSGAFEDGGNAWGSMRLSTWPLEDRGIRRENHCFKAEDLNLILGSDAMFAFKFDGPDGMRIISAVKDSGRDNGRQQAGSTEVSVIIPAFNIEDCIGRAVKSILDGSYQDYEIILVDDGSTDRTFDVCKKLEQSDKRIHAYHKENGGAGSARNHGLDKARGRYIAFIDGDDTVTPDYLDKLTSMMTEGTDWALCHYSVCPEKGEGPAPAFREASAGSRREYIRQFVFRTENNGSISSSAMGVFRRSVIAESGIRFREDLRYGEDILFNYEYAQHIGGFAYTPEPLYMYIQREGSTTHEIFRNSAIEDVLQFIKCMYEVVMLYNDKVPLRAAWYAYRQLYSVLYNYIGSITPFEGRKTAYGKFFEELNDNRVREIFCRIPEADIGFKGRILYQLIRFGDCRLLDTALQTRKHSVYLKTSGKAKNENKQ